jgi:hypothetical protein
LSVSTTNLYPKDQHSLRESDVPIQDFISRGSLESQRGWELTRYVPGIFRQRVGITPRVHRRYMKTPDSAQIIEQSARSFPLLGPLPARAVRLRSRKDEIKEQKRYRETDRYINWRLVV